MRYATYAQLVDFLSIDADMPPQAEGERLLDRASELVDGEIRFAVYDIDNDDVPTDSSVVEALRDATCAQVEYWLEVGEDIDVDNGGRERSIKLGPLHVEWGSASRVEPVNADPVAPRARRILGNAGLGAVAVSSW